MAGSVSVQPTVVDDFVKPSALSTPLKKFKKCFKEARNNYPKEIADQIFGPSSDSSFEAATRNNICEEPLQPTVRPKMRPALSASTPVIVSCISDARVSNASESAVPIACGLPSRAERPKVKNSTVTAQNFSIPNVFSDVGNEAFVVRNSLSGSLNQSSPSVICLTSPTPVFRSKPVMVEQVLNSDSIVFEESPVETNRASTGPSLERKPVKAEIDLGDSGRFPFQDGDDDVFADPSYAATYRKLLSKIFDKYVEEDMGNEIDDRTPYQDNNERVRVRPKKLRMNKAVKGRLQIVDESIKAKKDQVRPAASFPPYLKQNSLKGYMTGSVPDTLVTTNTTNALKGILDSNRNKLFIV